MSAQAQSTRSDTPRKKRRALKIVVALLVVLVVGLGVLIALAPTIAGAVAPGIIESAAGKSIDGTVKVEKASFSWGGPQRIGPVIVTDPDGSEIANVEVDVTAGLLGLATGSRDLGTITLSGSATIKRDAPEAPTNVEKIIKEQPQAQAPKPEPAGLPGLPKGLKAHLVVEDFDVTYVDAGLKKTTDGRIGAVKLANLKTDAKVEVGKPIVLKFQADALQGPDLAKATTPAGKLRADATITNLTDAAGALTIDAMSVNALISASEIDTLIVDALANQQGRLAEALGQQILFQANADGDMKNMKAKIAFNSESVNADANLKVADMVLTSDGPITIEAHTGRLLVLAPDLVEALEQSQELSITKHPSVTLSVDALSLPIPDSGEPDLRNAALTLNIATTGSTGTLALPGEKAQPLEIAPLKARLETRKLADGVRLTADGASTVGGKSAGKLSADFTVTELLDAKGMPKQGMPRIAGEATVEQLATAIVAPMLSGAGVVITKDIGPELNLAVSATPEGEATIFDLKGDAAAFKLDGGAKLDGQRITSTRAITAQFDDVASLVNRRTLDMGVKVISPASLKATIDKLDVDLAKLAGESPDLRGSGAHVKLNVGASRAYITTGEGKEAHVEAEPMTIDIDATDPSKLVRVLANAKGTIDSQPMGTLDAKLDVLGILDGQGAPSGLPKGVSGNASIKGFATAAAQPFVESMGIDLPRDIGPTIDASLVARSDTSNLQPGAIPETNLDLTLTSKQLKSESAFLLTGDRLRTRGDGASFTLANAGQLLDGFTGEDGGISVRPGGTVSGKIAKFSLPLDADRKPQLDKLALDSSFTISKLTVVASDQLKGPSPANTPTINLDALNLTSTFGPSDPIAFSIDSKGSTGSKPFSIRGDVTLAELKKQLRDGAVDPTAIGPTGSIVVTDLPTALVGLLPLRLKTADGDVIDHATLASGALGQTLNATLKLQEIEKNNPSARNITLVARSESMNTDASLALRPNRLDLKKLNTNLTVSQQAGNELMALLPLELASSPTFTSPATFNLKVNPISLPLKEGFAPDFSKLTDQRLTMDAKASAALANVVLPGAEGEPPMNIGQVGVKNFVLTADAPLAALLGGGVPGDGKADFNGVVTGDGGAQVASLVGKLRSYKSGIVIAEAGLTNLNTAWVERVANKPDLITGALGNTADVQISWKGDPTATSGEEARPLAFEAMITSPNVKLSNPAKITMNNDRLTLLDPVTADIALQPAFANRYMLGIDPANPRPGPKVAAPVNINARLDKLAISTAPGSGPLKPGVFDVGAKMTIPAVDLQLETGDMAKLRDFGVNAQTKSGEPNKVYIDVTTAAANMQQPATLKGFVANVANANGDVSVDTAAVTLQGSVPAFPTPLVDVIAKQNGTLTDLLGPSIALDLDAKNLSKTAGSLHAILKSEAATADISGNVQDGYFVMNPAGETPQVVIYAVEKDFSTRIAKFLPLVGGIRKTPGKNAPGYVAFDHFRFPMDGDIKKVELDSRIDPGEAEFEISNVFAQILKVAGQKNAGVVGRRFDHTGVHMRDGIATLDTLKIPIGEFILKTDGKADFNTDQQEIIAWVPVGALATEAAGGLGRIGIGELVGAVSEVPFRMKGPIGSEPKPQLATDLLGKGVVGTPENVLDAGKNVIGNILGGGKNGNK